MPTRSPLYDLTAKRLDGTPQPLSDYQGRVLLIVNTASKCGFTPQYTALQSLYAKYHPQGFDVLGFPCNQFGKQEPGTSDEIASFCDLNFGVTFPLFARIDVNGPNADPLYQWLTKQKRGFLGLKRIGWNFTKFLIDRNGQVIARYSPTTKPETLAAPIEALLAQ